MIHHIWMISCQFHVFAAQFVHFPAIFRVCVKKFYLSGQIIVDLWFKVLNQHSMTSKTVSQIFPVMFQSLLKPHYVYTAGLHKISPPLIVCRIWNSIFLVKSLLIYDSRSILSVPMAHLWLLFMKMGYQEENYNFWDFSTTITDQTWTTNYNRNHLEP
jgi:hypothetical protein